MTLRENLAESCFDRIKAITAVTARRGWASKARRAHISHTDLLGRAEDSEIVIIIMGCR